MINREQLPYVLCVDDEQGILDMYAETLGGGSYSESTTTPYPLSSRRRRAGAQLLQEHPDRQRYQVVLARSDEEAIEKVQALRARHQHISVGFFDMKMPGGIDGYETIQRIKALDPRMLVAVVTAYNDHPIMKIASLFHHQDEWIYLNKPFTHQELLQTANHLTYGWTIRWEREQTLSRLKEANQLLQEANVAIVMATVRMLEMRDTYTAGHSHRTAEFGKLIAQRLGWSQADCDQLYLGCLLHDIGKIGINDSILRKPDRLNPHEYEEMKQHSVLGAKFLVDSRLPALAPLVRHHHERMDGNGYPDRLSGADIPLGSRILAVADTFDALTSTRSYRQARGMFAARDILIDCQRTQHDVEVSVAFVSIINEAPELVMTRMSPEAISMASIKDPGVCPFC
ncbi:MAG: HD-GYP domain-containing protein [Myxococcota bacterium]